MPHEEEDRRVRQAGPPTQLILSYEKMGTAKRRKLFFVGIGILLFTVALPLVAGIWVDLPNVYWAFAFGGGTAGFACIWPEGAIYIFSSFGKMLPFGRIKQLLNKSERRDNDD